MTIYATREQTMQAIRDLTEAEMTMLAWGAAKRLAGTEFTEPHDLISEAISRLLRPSAPGAEALDPSAPEQGSSSEGKPRRWPLHMRFGPCLQLVMRSIVCASRRRLRNLPGSHADIDIEVGSGILDQEETPLAQVRHERLRAPSAEDEAAERERSRLATLAAEQARDSLKGDLDAQRVIDGMVAGLEPVEACMEFGILPELYEPARKRAARALRRRAFVLFDGDRAIVGRRAREGRHA